MCLRRCWWRGVHCWLEVTAGVELDQSLRYQQLTVLPPLKSLCTNKNKNSPDGVKKKNEIISIKHRINQIYESTIAGVFGGQRYHDLIIQYLILITNKIRKAASERTKVWFASSNCPELNLYVHLLQRLWKLSFTETASVCVWQELLVSKNKLI